MLFSLHLRKRNLGCANIKFLAEKEKEREHLGSLCKGRKTANKSPVTEKLETWPVFCVTDRLTQGRSSHIINLNAHDGWLIGTMQLGSTKSPTTVVQTHQKLTATVGNFWRFVWFPICRNNMVHIGTHALSLFIYAHIYKTINSPCCLWTHYDLISVKPTCKATYF